MGTPLNLVPPGLLDFFGIKSGDWGPRELGQLLTPTIDLSRWYLDAHAVEVAGVVAGSPFGNTATNSADITSTAPVDLCTGGQLDVPAGEIWLQLEAAIRWSTTDAAGSVSACFESGVPNQQFQILPTQDQGFTTGAAVTRGGGTCLLRPFWSLPGHRLRVRLNGIIGAAGSTTIVTRHRIVRFKR